MLPLKVNERDHKFLGPALASSANHGHCQLKPRGNLFVLVALFPGSKVGNVGMEQGHACATSNGNVYCWGSNNFGQLGTGNTINSLSPSVVNGLRTGYDYVKYAREEEGGWEVEKRLASMSP
jgi:hypothetical protein